MFQGGHQRELADEQHLCSSCVHDSVCDVRPEHFGWRYVLDYCQRYEKGGDDDGRTVET